MMSPLVIAVRRISQLEKELAELRRFVEMYHRFSAEASGNGNAQDAKPVENSDTDEVEEDYIDRAARRRSTATAEIVTVMENIIRAAGRPMTRTELVEPLEARDVHIAGADKARYLGTVLWRHRDRFRNLPSFGYWLKDEPYQPANYDPARDTGVSRLLDSEAGVAQKPENELLREHDALVAQIDEHNRRYHTEDAPTISDADYDKLLARKEAIEELLPERF